MMPAHAGHKNHLRPPDERSDCSSGCEKVDRLRRARVLISRSTIFLPFFSLLDAFDLRRKKKEKKGEKEI